MSETNETKSLKRKRNENICGACLLEEFEEEDIVARCDECNNRFHKECIKKWLQRDSSCPQCRARIKELRFYDFQDKFIESESIKEIYLTDLLEIEEEQSEDDSGDEIQQNNGESVDGVTGGATGQSRQVGCGQAATRGRSQADGRGRGRSRASRGQSVSGRGQRGRVDVDLEERRKRVEKLSMKIKEEENLLRAQLANIRREELKKLINLRSKINPINLQKKIIHNIERLPFGAIPNNNINVALSATSVNDNPSFTNSSINLASKMRLIELRKKNDNIKLPLIKKPPEYQNDFLK